MAEAVELRVGGLLARAVSDGVAPGMQAAWWSPATDLRRVCAGQTDLRGGGPVDDDTLFDIASLTKPFVGGTALRLVERGALALEARLDGWFPRLVRDRRGSATLEQLLAHEAGFAAWAPLFEGIPHEERGDPAGRDRLLDAALATPPVTGDREAVYSDLGYIVLGAVLERVTGAPLPGLVAAEVTAPLQLSSIHYRGILRPSPEALASEESSRSERSRTDVESSRSEPSAIAATEDCPWRGRVLRGEVHDDNAWTMGGSAGHAGLFASAGDLARFGREWLRALDGGGWLSRALAARAVTRRPAGRGLGWDLAAPTGSSAGSRMGQRTFGHLGFTGCSLWIDPDARLAAALLTNRVHPNRDDERIRALRPAFHDTLIDALRESGALSATRPS